MPHPPIVYDLHVNSHLLRDVWQERSVPPQGPSDCRSFQRSTQKGWRLMTWRPSWTNPSTWCARPSWTPPTLFPRATGPWGTERITILLPLLLLCPCLRPIPPPSRPPCSPPPPGCPITWPGNHKTGQMSWLVDAWSSPHLAGPYSPVSPDPHCVSTPWAEWRTDEPSSMDVCRSSCMPFGWLSPPSTLLYSLASDARSCSTAILFSLSFFVSSVFWLSVEQMNFAFSLFLFINVSGYLCVSLMLHLF